MKSPTQNTLQYLRSEGYLAAVVEHWNMHAKIRQDLFGFIDVLAIGHGETVGVQSTSRANISSRINKIEGDEYADALAFMRDANWKILVHGWDQPKGKGTTYRLKEVDLS